MLDFFELVYVDSIHLAVFFLLSIDLLDHIKADLLDLVFLLPSASTWSRLRHSDAAGQPPLRTRAFPLRLRQLAPPAHQKVHTGNETLEAISWCAEQTVLSNKIACSVEGGRRGVVREGRDEMYLVAVWLNHFL